MNTLSRCLTRMCYGEFNSLQSSLYSQFLVRPSCSRYFSSFAPLEPHLFLSERNFYAIRPSPCQLFKKCEQRTTAIQQYDGDPDSLFSGTFSKTNRLIMSWLYRQMTPAVLWGKLRSNPQVIREHSFALNLANLKLVGNREEQLTKIQTFLEEEVGEELASLSQDHLLVIWNKLKELKAYDEMVELVNCCEPSSFTSQPDILADYLFAHLHSAYAHPYLVKEIAEKLDHPRARYILGLAQLMRSQIAKKMTHMLQSKKIDSSTLMLYRESFPHLDGHEEGSQSDYQQALDEAEKALRQAYQAHPQAEYAISWMLSLIEKGLFSPAHALAHTLWQKFNHQAELSVCEIQALLFSGIVIGQPSSHLEKWVKRLLQADQETREECLESLETLFPYYHVTNHIRTLFALSLPQS